MKKLRFKSQGLNLAKSGCCFRLFVSQLIDFPIYPFQNLHRLWNLHQRPAWLLYKGGMMEQLKRGTQVKFNAISFIGEEIPMIGKVIGYAEEVRRLWPMEFAGMPENEEIYVILVQGNSQNHRYVATPNEIIEVVT